MFKMYLILIFIYSLILSLVHLILLNTMCQELSSSLKIKRHSTCPLGLGSLIMGTQEQCWNLREAVSNMFLFPF